MEEFTLLDLESQFKEVVKITEGWSSEKIIQWLSHFGTVVKMPHPYDDRLYDFRSPNGSKATFRFSEYGKLILVGEHTTRTG